MSGDDNAPKPSLADFARAVEAVTLLGQLEGLAQNTRQLTHRLEELTPAGLAQLLGADGLAPDRAQATARAQAAAFARAVYPLLAELERLGLYRRTR